MPRVSDKKIFFRGEGGLHGFQGEQWGNQPSLTELKGGLKKIDCRLRGGWWVGGINQIPQSFIRISVNAIDKKSKYCVPHHPPFQGITNDQALKSSLFQRVQ